MKLALPRIIAACLALGAAACDSLATGDFRPPYFSFDAHISSTLPPSSAVSIAVLWIDESSMRQSFDEQTLEVMPGVVKTTLQITQKPPASVLQTLRPDQAALLGLDSALQFAVGTVVAYLDNNGNRKLDATDQVVGAASDIDLMYLAQGTPAPATLIGIIPTVPAFSAVREPMLPDLPDPGQCGSFDANGHYEKPCQPTGPLPTLLAATDVVPLTLGSDGDQRWSCPSFLGPHFYADWSLGDASDICDGGVCPYCKGYQCPLDLPPADVSDPSLRFLKACSADGLAYTYRTCHDEPSLCGTTICHYGHGERLAGDPAPAGWPCP